MLALAILDGFCWDHGYHLGFDCPRCTNAKPQESAEDGHGRIYGLLEIYQRFVVSAIGR